jgi:hypothetical protein
MSATFGSRDAPRLDTGLLMYVMVDRVVTLAMIVANGVRSFNPTARRALRSRRAEYGPAAIWIS